MYSAQKGASKEDEELSSVPVLLRAGLSLETQWAFMQLGIPGGLMMAAEASSYDVTTALAGLLGSAQPDQAAWHPPRWAQSLRQSSHPGSSGSCSSPLQSELAHALICDP